MNITESPNSYAWETKKTLLRPATTAVVFAALFAATAARADLPAAKDMLADIGYSSSEIADIEAGKIVNRSVKGAHERDLAGGFAFHVPVSPAELVKDLKGGLLASVDPNTISRAAITAGTLDDFAKLSLTPDGEKRAKRYATAKPGSDLNLSTGEIAAFNAAGASATPAAVEPVLRNALLERYKAYRANGLGGIAPYAREKGTRSPADDLKVSLESTQALKKYAPTAYQAMLGYPNAKPPGTEETFSWTQLKAHDVPTIVLGHGMMIPDGDAFIVLQRQYYVSEGFNCEQAVAALLPAQDGTVVVYSNHTSTDQVAGFGGGTKRSIGSKLMASELEGIFSKLQKAAK